MNYNLIKIDFSTNMYSDLELLNRTNLVVEEMTGNLSFPNPDPSLADLTAKADLFSDAILKAAQGGKTETAFKKQVRAELVALLKKEVVYVESICNGDEVLALSSGFEIHKKSTPVGLLPMVTGLKAEVGPARGSLLISWDVVKKARVYEIIYTDNPNSDPTNWIHKIVTKHQILIEGLIRGKEYFFKVAAVGSDPNLVWCDPISSFVM